MIGASKSKFRNSDSLRFNCTASVRLRGYLGDRNFLRLAPLIRRIFAAHRKMSADEIANHANAVSPRLSQSALDSPRAWLMAVAAFFACFTIFGVVYSFGVFFKPMAAQFGASRAHTSIVFSLTAAIYNLLGLAAGHLSDRFGPRRVMTAGAIAIGAGLFFTASAGSLWFGCVAYGLGVGVGVACWYVPALAVVGGWFLKRRTAALGVAVSGVGCGTLVVVPIAAALIQRFGWREAYLIMGMASSLALLGCAWIVAAPPLHETAAAAPIQLTAAMGTRDFVLLYVSSVLSSVSIYIPFVYLPDFAHSHGASRIAAAALVGIIGAASVGGRLGLGAVAGRASTISLYKATMLLLGLSYAFWIGAHSYATLVVFALVMGASYGGMIALSPAVVAEIFGVRGLGALLGALYTSSSISALAGPPLAGFVIDRTGSYLWVAAMAGGCSLVGYAALMPLNSRTIAADATSAAPTNA
jgi:MFS family permease